MPLVTEEVFMILRKITACILVLALATSLFAVEETMSVQNKTGDIREHPTALGKVLTSVKLGDQVTVLEKKGSWARVTTLDGKTTGWIHSTALEKTKRRLAASGTNAETGASTEEASLAMKGFTEQVEKDYKAKHTDIDFTWIDKMGQIKIPTTEVLAFLKEGNVVVPEGGAK